MDANVLDNYVRRKHCLLSTWIFCVNYCFDLLPVLMQADSKILAKEQHVTVYVHVLFVPRYYIYMHISNSVYISKS